MLLYKDSELCICGTEYLMDNRRNQNTLILSQTVETRATLAKGSAFWYISADIA
jgi:hypothetical protein